MKAFRIKTAYGFTIVIAEDYAQAENIFKSHYWPTEIREIEQLPEEVLLKMKPKEK